MGWKERRKSYESEPGNIGFLEGEAIGRAIFSALGATESAIPKLCLSCGVEYSADRPVLDLAWDVLGTLSGGAVGRTVASQFVADARKMGRKGLCWDSDDELGELCAIAGAAGSGMLVFGRIPAHGGGSPVCCMTAFVNGEAPEWLLRPVCSLIARSGGTSVWRRRLKEGVRDMAEANGWLPGKEV